MESKFSVVRILQGVKVSKNYVVTCQTFNFRRSNFPVLSKGISQQNYFSRNRNIG